jgi:hypothetical protein
VDAGTIQFFENDLEIPATELVSKCQESSALKEWGLSLKLQQLSYILSKIPNDVPLSFGEQRTLFLKTSDNFIAEYLLSFFSRFKSPEVIQRIFDSEFKNNPPIKTSDKFVQLVALYRADKSALTRIQLFQKVQKRSCKLWTIPGNWAQLQSFEEFATKDKINQALQSTNQKILCQHVEKLDDSLFLFFRKAKDLILVLPTQSFVGDYRYKPDDIVIQFYLENHNIAIYSSTAAGRLITEQVFEYFLKTSVKLRPLEHLTSNSVVGDFVADILAKAPESSLSVCSVQFKTANICMDSTIEFVINTLVELSFASFVQKIGFSAKDKLLDLLSIKLTFESHHVTLFFQYYGDKCLVLFASRAFPFSCKSRFVAWGSSYGISFIEK